MRRCVRDYLEQTQSLAAQALETSLPQAKGTMGEVVVGGREGIEAMVGEAEGLSRIFVALTAVKVAQGSFSTRTTQPNLGASLLHAAAMMVPLDARHLTLREAIGRTRKFYEHQGDRTQGEGALDLLTGEVNLVDGFVSALGLNLSTRVRVSGIGYQPPPILPASWTTRSVSVVLPLPTSLMTAR